MKILNYNLYSNQIQLFLSNGTWLTIYFNINSGKAYYRYKINSISKVKHPGIFIGTDTWGNEYFIHNHYEIGTASLVTGTEFTKGTPIYLYKQDCINEPVAIVSKAFEHLMRGEKYSFYLYNCQTLVNDACDNKRKSEDVEKWAGGILATGVIALLLGAVFSSSKT